MLGKNDQLAAVALGIEHLRLCSESSRKFFPFLSVPTARTWRRGPPGRLSIPISSSSSSMVRAAVAWSTTSLRPLRPRRRAHRPGRRDRHRRSGRPAIRVMTCLRPAFEQLLLTQAVSPVPRGGDKRLVDGLRRRGQAALKDGQGEADGALATSFSSASARLNSSRTYSVTCS